MLRKGERNFVLPTNGGNQEVLCIELDYLPIWLAKIPVTPAMLTNMPDVADKLVRYQLKAKDVLAEVFLSKQKKDYSYTDELNRRAKAINAELKADNNFRKQAESEARKIIQGEKTLDDLNGYPRLREAVERLLERAIKLTDWFLVEHQLINLRKFDSTADKTEVLDEKKQDVRNAVLKLEESAKINGWKLQTSEISEMMKNKISSKALSAILKKFNFKPIGRFTDKLIKKRGSGWKVPEAFFNPATI